MAVTDKSILEQKLGALAEAGMAGKRGRALRGDTPDALLAALLREVDTLVLPRLLTLEASKGAIIRCEVSGRRLLRVKGDAGREHAPLEGRDLDGGEEGLADALKAYFLSAFGSAPEVFARTGPLEREVGPADPGISAWALATSWSLSLVSGGGDDGGDVIDSFLSEIGGDLTAWMLRAAEDGASAGEPDALEQLDALDIDSAPSLAADGAEPVLFVLSLSDDDNAVLVARTPGMSLVALTPKATAPRATEVWRRAAGA